MIEEVQELFESHLYLPDPRPLLAVLGTAAINLYGAGEPVWLLPVGASSGSKTEIVRSVEKVSGVEVVGNITKAGLLNGTARRERETEGLLRRMKNPGLLVCKDFTAVISMHRDARAEVLSALRDVYDGHMKRDLGTGMFEWRGRLGFIGGVTEAIDKAHGVMSAMGERFMFIRFDIGDREEQGRKALQNSGRENEMREERAKAVAQLFNKSMAATKRFSEEEITKLLQLANFTTSCRGAVDRDSTSKEIELSYSTEGPARFVKALSELHKGLQMIGVSTPLAWQVVIKVAGDSMPVLRKQVVEALYNDDDIFTMNTNRIAEAIQYPITTTKRALEDLRQHNVVTSDGTDWCLNKQFREACGLVRASTTFVGRTPTDQPLSSDEPMGYQPPPFSPKIGATKVVGPVPWAPPRSEACEVSPKSPLHFGSSKAKGLSGDSLGLEAYTVIQAYQGG